MLRMSESESSAVGGTGTTIDPAGTWETLLTDGDQAHGDQAQVETVLVEDVDANGHVVGRHSEQFLTKPVADGSLGDVFGPPQRIAPVRSPGIVIPAPPAPVTKPVVEEIAADDDDDESSGFVRHALPWLLLVLAVLAGLFALAQLVPGWWSGFIARLVDGYSARGVGWGAGMGFIFTYLATLLIGHAFHRWTNWKAPIALVVGGLIVLAPNLFTLWINHGPTTAARTANALLDRTAPLFRGASLAGAAAGLLLGVLTTVLYRMWRRRTRQLKTAATIVENLTED
jgi:MFS family permease